MQSMPNNLNQMIRQANMTKREVAALKGITPENLSRQVNGHTNITLQDAEHYAKILDCSPQDVLFALPPVPIIGYCKIIRCDPKAHDCPPTGVRIEREPMEKGFVSENAYQHESYAYLENPVQEFGVDRRLVCGIVYPEPGGVYTVHNNDTGLAVKGQKLLWAAASLSVSFRPKLRGLEIILDD